jgi:hypothetical protein
VDDYYLGGYDSGSVSPPGQLDVRNKAAEAASGRLRISFSLGLPGVPSAQSAVAVLIATGPLHSDGSLAVRHGSISCIGPAPAAFQGRRLWDDMATPQASSA